MSDLELIKADLRAAMNGVASKVIRESGMDYKLVYGIELPRLREIASAFTPDQHLAMKLWQEDVRECKMLAVMLFPLDEFDADIAEIWIESLQSGQAEIAQLLAMDLLCRTSYAAERSFQWIADERQMFQLCGFLTLTRLLMQGAILSPDAEAEFIDQAAATLPSDYLPLRKAVQNALLRFADTSEAAQEQVNMLFSL